MHDTPPNPPQAERTWQKHCAWAAVVLAACAFFVPYFSRPTYVNPTDDWLQHAARHLAVHVGVREFGQLPLRSHFFGGGYPTLWNPEDPTLSPFVLLTFLCGEVMGLKLLGFLFHIVGAVGTYLLARGVYRQGRVAAFAAACVIAFSSWTATRVYKGNLNELYFLAFPLAVWLLAKSRASRGAFVGLVLLMAGLAMDGKLTWFSMMFFLGLAALRLCVFARRGRDLSPLVRFALMAILAAMLAAPKLLPIADMFASRGGLDESLIARHSNVYSPKTIEAFSLLDVWRVLTRPVVGADYAPSPDCVGLPAVIFAGLGLLLGGWRLWRDGLIALLALLLVMAYYAPVDVFRAFKALPGFSMISVPAKYFDFYIILFVALMAGHAIDRIARLRRGARVAVAAALLALLPYEFMANQPLLESIFTEPLPKITDRAVRFYQVRGIRMKTTGRRTLHSNNYYNVRRRVGTIDQFTAIPLPAHAEPKFFVDPEDKLHRNDRYRGEVFVAQGDAKVARYRLTPNRIDIELRGPGPASVVVNQNYDRYWRASAGKVVPRDGLLAVELPAGARSVTLTYLPTPFYWGLAVAGLGLALLVVCARWLHSPECGRDVGDDSPTLNECLATRCAE